MMFGWIRKKRVTALVENNIDYRVKSELTEMVSKKMLATFTKEKGEYYRNSSTMDELKRKAIESASITIAHDLVNEFKEKILTEVMTDDLVLNGIKEDIKSQVTSQIAMNQTGRTY